MDRNYRKRPKRQKDRKSGRQERQERQERKETGKKERPVTTGRLAPKDESRQMRIFFFHSIALARHSSVRIVKQSDMFPTLCLLF
jgi:hypothetical protein